MSSIYNNNISNRTSKYNVWYCMFFLAFRASSVKVSSILVKSGVVLLIRIDTCGRGCPRVWDHKRVIF